MDGIGYHRLCKRTFSANNVHCELEVKGNLIGSIEQMRANQICTWMIFEVRRGNCLNLSLSDSYADFWNRLAFCQKYLQLFLSWPNCVWITVRTSWGVRHGCIQHKIAPILTCKSFPWRRLGTLTNHEKSWVWRIPKWLHASPPNICHHFHQCLNFGWKHGKKILHDSGICFSYVLFGCASIS